MTCPPAATDQFGSICMDEKPLGVEMEKSSVPVNAAPAFDVPATSAAANPPAAKRSLLLNMSCPFLMKGKNSMIQSNQNTSRLPATVVRVRLKREDMRDGP